MAQGVTLLTAKDIEFVGLALEEIVAIIRSVYADTGQGSVQAPDKIGIQSERAGSFLTAMPAYLQDRQSLGMKWVSYFPGNADLAVPASNGLIILNHPDNGLPLAILEGMWITYARTVACAAVMAQHLLAGSPHTLGLVGAGGLARWVLRCFGAVFPSLRQVRVFARRANSRREFMRDMSDLGPWEIEPVTECREAVAGLDIVVSSTPQISAPPIQAEWWLPGTLALPLDVLGGWHPSAIGQADLLVSDSLTYLQKIADRRGLTLPSERMSISDLVLGRKTVHMQDGKRIIAIPAGVASTDIAVGWEVYRRALQAGLGTPFHFV